MAPRIVLATVGSLGDLHPFMAIAHRLQALGADPIIAAAPDYAPRVAAAGIPFHGMRPGMESVQRDLGVNQAELARRAAKDSWYLIREIIFPSLRASYEDSVPLMKDASLVATSSLAFSAKLAAEAQGVRHVAIVLQPIMFFSAYDPPTISELPWLAGLLRSVGPNMAGALIRVLKRMGRSRSKPLFDLRRELGLPEHGIDAVIDGQFPADGTALALYSTLLGAKAPDFPARTEITGFTFYDGAEADPPDQRDSLQRFVNSGPPPLVFTLGSFVGADAGDFYEVSLQVARALKMRAILVVGEHAMSTSRLRPAEDVFIVPYAAYSTLFNRCAVIVHQGGVGTSAQALRAGRPHLVVPFSGDQPDNAARLVRLGVARSLKRKEYRVARVAEALRDLSENPKYASRAREASETVTREDGAQRAAELLLSYAG
jgi:UDP:flavonoid glycosyltransferase YjiC (YdhE family)